MGKLSRRRERNSEQLQYVSLSRRSQQAKTMARHFQPKTNGLPFIFILLLRRQKKTFSLNFRSISFPLDANVIFRVQTVKHYSRFITAAEAKAMSDVYCRAVFQFSLSEKIMREHRKRIEYQ